jgi:hypothetical protein
LYVDPYELYTTQYLLIWKGTFAFFPNYSAFHSSNYMIADKGPATPLSALEKDDFLHQFLEMPVSLRLRVLMEQNFEMYDVAWWVRSQDEVIKHPNCENPNHHAYRVQGLFSYIHSGVSRKIVFHYMSFTNSIFSAIGIKDVALFTGTSERRCSRSFKSSVGRFQAGCTCCAIDSATWNPMRLVSRGLERFALGTIVAPKRNLDQFVRHCDAGLPPPNATPEHFRLGSQRAS